MEKSWIFGQIFVVLFSFYDDSDDGFD